MLRCVKEGSTASARRCNERSLFPLSDLIVKLFSDRCLILAKIPNTSVELLFVVSWFYTVFS